MTPTPCDMCHSQNCDKIDNFLKPVFNIFILGNLIVGWGEAAIKEGAGILHNPKDLGEVFIVGKVRFIKVVSII